MEKAPLTDGLATLSPYQYVANDPIANIDMDGLAAGFALPGITVIAKAIHRSMPSISAVFISGISQTAKLANMTSMAVPGAEIAGTAINNLGITESVGTQGVNLGGGPGPQWWQKIQSFFKGAGWNFTHNMNEDLAVQLRVTAAMIHAIQKYAYGDKNFSKLSGRGKAQLITETVQMVGSVALPELGPEGELSETVGGTAA